MVVVIPSVPQGIDGSKGAGGGGGKGPTPGVIAVLCHGIAGGVQNPDDIALKILAVNVPVVGIGGGVGEAHGGALRIVMEVEGVVVSDFRRKSAAQVDVAVDRAAHRLLDPQAGVVVDKAQTGGAIAGGGKLPPTLPGEGPAPVTQRITDPVISDGVPIIGGQQVPPIAVVVGVAGDDDRVGGLPVLVVVLGFGGDVADLVGDILPGFFLLLVILPFHFVQEVVGVGRRVGPVAVRSDDRGDVAAVVVGIGKGFRVAVNVLERGNLGGGAGGVPVFVAVAGGQGRIAAPGDSGLAQAAEGVVGKGLERAAVAGLSGLLIGVVVVGIGEVSAVDRLVELLDVVVAVVLLS